jgi:hypothetical protein
MLYVCTDILQFHIFAETFQKRYESIRYIDLSKTTTQTLVDECDSIVHHHKECSIFLGYLEPGWMLEPTHQTRLRKLFRKFPVGLVLQYPESLPYSWKNEIDIIYMGTGVKNHGDSDTLNDGGALHDKSEV